MTFKSVSTSGSESSKASSLFDLNENGKKSILVYKYRSGAKGLEFKTEGELCAELDNGECCLASIHLPDMVTLTLANQTPRYHFYVLQESLYPAATVGSTSSTKIYYRPPSAKSTQRNPPSRLPSPT